MPLRDHFRPPLDDRTSWDGFHASWPTFIMVGLNRRLPRRYVAEPHVHLGSSVEVDLATFEEAGADPPSFDPGDAIDGGGVATATAVWAPPAPTLALEAGPPEPETYEVRVYDTRRHRRLVAAVELVSPGNLDRPEARRALVGKCAGLLRRGVGVAIVDLVTTRAADLFGELLEFLGPADRPPGVGPSPIYAASCRWARRGPDAWWLEAWAHPLSIGGPLPTLPLWLAGELAVPLELDASYEEACRALRISDAVGATD